MNRCEIERRFGILKVTPSLFKIPSSLYAKNPVTTVVCLESGAHFRLYRGVCLTPPYKARDRLLTVNSSYRYVARYHVSSKATLRVARLINIFTSSRGAT